MRRLALFCSILGALVCAGPAAAVSEKPVCPGPASKSAARCHAHVVTDGKGRPLGRPQPQQAALTPADLRNAYGLASASLLGGDGHTIAIVDAYDYPSALSDLNTYRTNFGMATLAACTPGQTSACFEKLDQDGGTNYPATNTGWAEEMALDLDMASAICPACRLVLVEGNSSSLTDLGTAVNTAVNKGANVVSNSYGTNGEFSSEGSALYADPYNHPGVAMTVSSGDAGYGVEYPAALNTVTAVGGTSLTKNSNGTWSETAWSGAGSGCSAVISKPSWQASRSDITGCARRVVSDVSAVADPNTGVSVYDTFGHSTAPWLKFGGTSVAAPLVAGFYAVGGDFSTSFTYAHTSALRDVTSGSNGRRCSPTYLCTARVGFDGPTGLGTPIGTGAF